MSMRCVSVAGRASPTMPSLKAWPVATSLKIFGRAFCQPGPNGFRMGRVGVAVDLDWRHYPSNVARNASAGASNDDVLQELTGMNSSEVSELHEANARIPPVVRRLTLALEHSGSAGGPNDIDTGARPGRPVRGRR